MSKKHLGKLISEILNSNKNSLQRDLQKYLVPPDTNSGMTPQALQTHLREFIKRQGSKGGGKGKSDGNGRS